MVTFTPVDPPGKAITALLGDGDAAVTAAGGWTAVTRARRTSITEWQGYDPYSMDIPIIFDGLATDASQEAVIFALYQMMRKPVGPRKEPPAIRITGAVPLIDRRYIINAIAAGSAIRRSSDGARVQALFTVTVMEYSPGGVVVEKSTPATASRSKVTSSGGTATRTGVTYYTVKSGDTLSSIAARTLGSASRWHEIADLNSLRDPNHISPGQRLKMPTGAVSGAVNRVQAGKANVPTSTKTVKTTSSNQWHYTGQGMKPV